MHPRLFGNVLARNEAAAARLGPIHNNDRVRERAAVNDDGVITRSRNAGHEPKDQGRVHLVNLGLDKLDAVLVGGMVKPDERLRHAAAAERHLIFCSPVAGPSRYERRRAYKNAFHPQILPAGSRHLGDFDGRRKRLAPSLSADDGTIARDLTSLAWLCAFLIVVAFVVGAL